MGKDEIEGKQRSTRYQRLNFSLRYDSFLVYTSYSITLILKGQNKKINATNKPDMKDTISI